MRRLTFIVILYVFFVNYVSSAILEKRLKELESNQSFMEIWHDHIKNWRDEYDSKSDEDNGEDINCDSSNERDKATSVHRLTPSDIEIIGALGDSKVAATAAGADSLLTLLLDYRGVSYAIGGDDDLSHMVTVPNILKEMNPNITGQSYQIGGVSSVNSQLNLAVSGEKFEDLKAQAKQLVRRLKDIPFYEQKWKLITIDMGTNNVCQFCRERGAGPLKWIKEYKKALDYLHSKLRNAFINVLSVRSSSVLKALNDRYDVCEWLYKVSCPCLDDDRLESYQSEFQQLLANLVERYDRDDFTVVFQPFWGNFSNSNNTNSSSEESGEIDIESKLTYMAPDCIHSSTKGHASAARYLWNNMMESHNDKTEHWDLDEPKLKCPNKDCPYLRTRRNSIDCEDEESSEETTKFYQGESSEEINGTAVTEVYSEEDNELLRRRDKDETRATRSHRTRRTRHTHHTRRTRATRSHTKHTRATRDHTRHTHATRDHTRHTRTTREHTRVTHNHSDHTRHTHDHTSYTGTVESTSYWTSTTENNVRSANLRQSPHQAASGLPWIIGGILGALMVTISALLIAQRYARKRNNKASVTEKSPLLPANDEEMMY